MKKLLSFLVLVMLFTFTNAQSIVFHENFDPPSNADSVTAAGATANWVINTRLYASATQCDSNIVSVNDTAYLTTNSFVTTGMPYVYLKFSHICKIEILDAGEVEISVNGGPWVKLTGTEYINPGNSQFVNSGNKFNANTYPLDWYPAVLAQKPDQTWWRNETFNISALAGNSANVRVRFVLRDGNGTGANFCHGWYIDNVQVVASVSEITPPRITMKPPVLQDTLTSTGPFDIYAWIADASGIDTAYIVYKVNNGSNIYVPMHWVSDTTYLGTIPSYSYTNRIDYHVHAIDNAANHNANDGTNQWFYIKQPGNIVQIGTGTSTQVHPFYTNYGYSRSASIYTSAEIGYTGIISSLQWYVATAASPNAPVKIYLKSTTASAFSSGDTWSNLISGATLVYDGTTAFSTVGWKLFALTTPFNYSTGNLMVLCEANYGGSGTSSYPYFQYTATSGNSTQYIYQDSSPPTGTCTLSTSRPNIKIAFPPVNVAHDAGVKQIFTPTGTVLAGVNLPVNLMIQNYGTDTLKKVSIAYQLDGVLQAPYAWTGLLPFGVVSSHFDIGNVNVGIGSHVIKAWTELPNDSADQKHVNDTSSISFYACSSLLNGTYTVGGVGADFATLADVMTALNNCGVGGPVTFLLNDGTYTGQLLFNSINGVSAVNTITFKPNTGANVILTGTASSTIKFNGADYIMFDGSNNGTSSQNMTITNTNTSSSAVVWIASLGNNQGCLNITIKNCKITGASLASGYYGIAVGGSSIASNGADNDNILLQNNTICKAYVGIWAQGNATTNPGLMDNFQAISNTIGSNNASEYLGHDGIMVANTTGSTISQNKIFNIITSNTTPVGITLNTGTVSTAVTRNNINNIIYTSTGGYGGRGMYVSTGSASSNLTIANNIIYKIGGDGYTGFSNSSPVGMYFDGTIGGLNIYYNSVYMNGNLTYGAATLTTAILFNTSTITGINLKNNVFQNSMINTANTSAKNYAIYSVAPSTSFTGIDYNDYYTTGTQGVLGYLGAAQATIAAWRTATTQDVNSMSTDPNFLSTTDLHTFSANLNGHATPIVGITDDYTGNLRNATTPDIGAYEYDIPGKNLGIVSILQPVSSCALTATENVVFRLKNWGGLPIDTAELYYKVNNGTPVHEQMIHTIAPDSLYNYTFTTQVDLSVAGTYIFKGYLAVNGDTTHINDTINNYVVDAGYNLDLNPYTMGFEPTDDMTTWSKTDVNGDGYGWTYPYTGNAHSGSKSAELYNSGATGNDWLFSRCFKLNAGSMYKIEFWYKAGSTSAQNIDFKVGNANTPAAMTTTLSTLASFTNTGYQKVSVTFTPTTTGTYYFGWWGHSTVTYTYAYLDDINISLVPLQEAALLSVTAPNSGCGLSYTEPVTIKIKNTGSDVINGNLTASYTINAGTVVSESVTNTINVGDTLTYTFTQPGNFHVTAIDSLFALKTWISLTGDPYQFNDTVSKTIASSHVPAIPTVISDTVAYGTPATLRAISPDSIFWYANPTGGNPLAGGHIYVTPNLYTLTVYYAQATTPGGTTTWNFDSGLEGWTPTATCSSPVTWVWSADGGHGSLFAVDHPTNSSQMITSPVINLNGTPSMILRYAHHFATETGWDHGFVAYRFDGGAWLQFTPTVGAYTTSDAEYQEPLWNSCGTSPNMPLYDGTMTLATHSGPINTSGHNTLEIAFVFTTDGSGAVDGWYIDNVTLDAGMGGCASTRVPDTAYLELYPYEASVVSMTSPVSQCTDGSENVTIRIRNNGFNTISGGLNANYTVNGSAVVTEPVTSTINPGDTLTFTFATPLIAGLTSANQDSTYNITSYIELTGDLFQMNDTIHKSVDLLYTPPVPVVVNDTIPYGTTAVLHATATDSVNWYDVATGGTILSNSSTFVTPILYNTTVYYVEAMAGSGIDSLLTTTAGGNGCNGGNMFDLISTGSNLTITGFAISPYNSGAQTVNVYIKNGTYLGSETNAADWTLIGTYNINAPSAYTLLNLDCADFTVPAGQTVGVYVNFYASYTTVGSVTTYSNADIQLVAGVGLCGQFSGTNTPRAFNGKVYYQSGSGCTSARVPDTVFVNGVPACDMSAQVMYTPNSGIELTSTENVTIRVKNYGSAVATNIPVSYQINGGAPVTEIIPGPINSNDTLVYIFTTPADLSAYTTYVITAYTGLVCDTTHTNDTIVKTITNNPLLYCASTATSTADDDIIHVVFAGIDNVSPTPYTAMYTDYTLTVPPAICALGIPYPISVSTGFSTTNTYSGYIEVYIDYNRNGIFEEPSEVAFGDAYSGIQTISGVITVPLTAVTGTTTRMRLVCVEGGDASSVTPCGTYTWGETEDYFVFLKAPIPHDAGVTAIIQPVSPEAEGASVPVRAIIQNYGTDTIKASNNLQIAYSLNGGLPVITSYATPPLAPLATDTVTLPNITVPAGNNNICAYTILAGDSNTFNDTICKAFYGNPQSDAGVIAFIQPGTLSTEGAAQNVTVILKNFGSNNLTATDLSYSINGIVQATESWVGNLVPNGTDTVAFAQTFIVPAGSFAVCAYTSLATDGDHSNDTLCMNSYGLFTSTLPYYDNFDGGTVNWTQTNDGGGTVWELGTPSYGSTNSAHSAPNAWDVNLATTYTNYAVAYLYTQNFDFSTAVNAKLSFWVNVDVETCCDGLTVQYSTDNSVTWNNLGSVSDPMGTNWYTANTGGYPSWVATNGWIKAEYKLNAFNNTPVVRFRFLFHSDVSATESGASIDDISITIPSPIDAGVELIKAPLVQAPAGSLKQVKVRIRNFGTDTLNSIPVSYKAGSLPAVTETYNGQLAADDTVTYTFTQQLTIPAGAFTLMSYTGVPSDGDNLNDTTKIIMTGVPTFNVPYSDDFEGTVYFFGMGTSNLWEWGVPASSVINTAHSPTHAWKTNLDGNYVDNANDFLYTPYFNFSMVDSSYLDFWHWYNTESGADGCNIQYTLNSGTTWLTLGYNGDPLGTNWYTSMISGTPCWNGNSTGYVHSTYHLTSTSTIINSTVPVQFRFRFFSNGSSSAYDGWAVDDFALTAPPIPTDAGITAVVQPSAPTQTGTNVTVELTVKNYGTSTLTSIPVAYVVNGGAVTNETWTGSLAPGATTNYTFTTPFVSPASTYELCGFTKLIGDTYWYNDSTCVSVGTTPANHDVGVVNILIPGDTTIVNDSIEVTIQIVNFGTTAETTIPLVYLRNGAQVAAEIWNGTLGGGDTTTYTFYHKYVSPYSNYSLCARTVLSNDANPANNEFCKYPFGTVGIESYDYLTFLLLQNIPNPANNNTAILYYVPQDAKVHFELTDMLGQVLISNDLDALAGENRVDIDAAKMPVGIYFYSVEYKGQKLTKRMVITK